MSSNVMTFFQFSICPELSSFNQLIKNGFHTHFFIMFKMCIKKTNVPQQTKPRSKPVVRTPSQYQSMMILSSPGHDQTLPNGAQKCVRRHP